MSLNSIEELIDDVRQGKMVILIDDEDRENEGDLIMAASMVRAEDINFMARYGRGLICLTLTENRCQQLQLPLMVNDTHDNHSTNFTVSIEAAKGVTTGISAADRATTILAAVAKHAGPQDIVQPGHIFPLMAQSGGVLTRAGHTEAGSDIARLAGFEAASVIVEILNDDGSMARRPELEKFAQDHHIKIGTIADLIRYRINNEKTVEPVGECRMPTAYGEFRLRAYHDSIDHQVHLALIYGNIEENSDVMVRVHIEDTLCDMLSAVRNDITLPLQDAMQRVISEGCGVIVILRRPEQPNELVRRIKEYQLRDKGVEFPKPEISEDLRTYGVGAQILVDLGVHRMRVLGTPRKLHGLSGFDLELVEYISCE
ncbi:MAG: bifunctional 3,4-dihydroxy-2-butanone-4-phosphate synthase/GTP cyclohydrolase II [Gammaproteobacteria bacterium]